MPAINFQPSGTMVGTLDAIDTKLTCPPCSSTLSLKELADWIEGKLHCPPLCDFGPCLGCRANPGDDPSIGSGGYLPDQLTLNMSGWDWASISYLLDTFVFGNNGPPIAAFGLPDVFPISQTIAEDWTTFFNGPIPLTRQPGILGDLGICTRQGYRLDTRNAWKVDSNFRALSMFSDAHIILSPESIGATGYWKLGVQLFISVDVEDHDVQTAAEAQPQNVPYVRPGPFTHDPTLPLFLQGQLQAIYQYEWRFPSLANCYLAASFDPSHLTSTNEQLTEPHPQNVSGTITPIGTQPTTPGTLLDTTDQIALKLGCNPC